MRTFEKIQNEAMDDVLKLRDMFDFMPRNKDAVQEVAGRLLGKIASLSAKKALLNDDERLAILSTSLHGAANTVCEYGDTVCRFVAEIASNNRNADPRKYFIEYLEDSPEQDQMREAESFEKQALLLVGSIRETMGETLTDVIKVRVKEFFRNERDDIFEMKIGRALA